MRVLNCCSNDWANFSHDNAKSLREVGVDCVDVKLSRHLFNYPTQSTIIDRKELIQLINTFDIIQIFHTDSITLEFTKGLGKRVIMYYCDSNYRSKSIAYNKTFDPYIEKAVIALGEFAGLGAKHETYLFGATEVGEYQIKKPSNPYKIGHYPSNVEVKGTVEILQMLEKVNSKYELTYSTTIVPYELQKKRMNECDIYIELFKPELGGKKYGSFGITALEAAALGKIVVTQNLSKSVYTSVYGKCPMIFCDTEDEFINNIEKLLSLSSNEINNLQKETYEWVKKNHSYQAHGERVRGMLGI